MRELDRMLLLRILEVDGATTSGMTGGGSFLDGASTEDRLLLLVVIAGVWKESMERARETGRLASTRE